MLCSHRDLYRYPAVAEAAMITKLMAKTTLPDMLIIILSLYIISRNNVLSKWVKRVATNFCQQKMDWILVEAPGYYYCALMGFCIWTGNSSNHVSVFIIISAHNVNFRNLPKILDKSRYDWLFPSSTLLCLCCRCCYRPPRRIPAAGKEQLLSF